MDKQNETTISQQIVSSCTGAIITSIFVTPLDVVKIRIQAQQKEFMKNKCFLYCNGLMDHICYCNGNSTNGNKDLNKQIKWFKRPAQFNGTIDGIFKIAKTEGITSLWSGLPPTLVMAVPATIVYFTFYDKMKLGLCKKFDYKDVPIWIPMVSGACGRIFSACLISPLEMIRTKMQSKKLSYSEIRISINQMIRQEGVISLYKGLLPTLLRDVPFSCIYWCAYESLKKKFNQNVDNTSFLSSFIFGAISGSIAATITLPFDVVKTHKQIELGENMFEKKIKKQNTSEIMNSIYKKNGIKGLFAGLGPRVFRVAPACAIMISTYEFGKKFFQNVNNQKDI